MAENFDRSVGRSKRYKLDAGGAPAETGPFVGLVKNNTDTTRTGKLMVYNEFLSGPNENDPAFWTPVSYVSPFFGSTEGNQGGPNDEGGFAQNKHSYGMWFTPPDVGTKILFVFANGDPNIGYYLGTVVNEDAHHMVPAIGSTSNVSQAEKNSIPYFANSTRLPTVEINDNNRALREDPRFFDKPKPIHQVQAFALMQQGLLNDPIRGSIGSNSYRESPSTVFGISTPGRPVYQGGYSTETLQARLNQDANSPGSVPAESMKVVGREGGHSVVLDDGDINGDDQLIRIRTAKGHQILLSDSGNTLYIAHANGQSWWELGAEGTIDMYAANSVNIRGGDVNIHADRTLNMFGTSVNLVSNSTLNVEGKQMQITGTENLSVYSEKYIGVKSDGSLSLNSSKAGTWEGGGSMVLSAGCIDLNGGKAPSVAKTTPVPRQKLPDTKFTNNVGWEVENAKIETVVTRAPTHEPWPAHNTGVSKVTTYTGGNTLEPTPEVKQKLDSVQDAEFTPITTTNFETQKAAETKLGTLEPEHVTGMLAQASVNVPQDYNVISNELGLGKYGLKAEQLEKSGYLKPGTTEFFLTDGSADFDTIMQSSTVWTGKNGVNNLTGVLGDEALQDTIKTDLYTSSFNELRSAGVITGSEAPENIAPLVESASQYGTAETRNWVYGRENTSIGKQIDKAARSSQYSVGVVNEKLSTETKGYSTTSYSTGTVNRTEVDKASETIIRETKVSKPAYATTRTAQTRDPNDPRVIALRTQISQLRQQMPEIKRKWDRANPGGKFSDFLNTPEAKAIKEKIDRLQTELESI